MLAASPEMASMQGPRGATALHVAARYGHIHAVSLLLAACADVGVADEQGNRPADKARAFGHVKVAEMLESAQREQLAATTAATAAAAAGGTAGAGPATATAKAMMVAWGDGTIKVGQ
eukprot:3138858-Pleurochrysis_carterae.AAC.1